MSGSESDKRRDSFYDGDEDVSYDDIGSERLSEIYDRDSESTESVGRMGPPKSIPPEEMKLRREKQELTKEIAGLREEIGYKDEMIDLLKIHNATCKKEKGELISKIDTLEKEIEYGKDELTSKIVKLEKEIESYGKVMSKLQGAKGGTRRKRFKRSRRK